MEKGRILNVMHDLVENIQFKGFELKAGILEKTDHYVVVEENRQGAYFATVVPKERYPEFRQLQINNPNANLKSMLVGRRNNKEVRIAFFGDEI
jgi:hypothetical protein